MSFTFSMSYKPGYQKRLGQCQHCKCGIEMGSRTIVGTGYYHKFVVSKRYHYQCFIVALENKAGNWFMENFPEKTPMPKEVKMELERLRAKKNFLSKKGLERAHDVKELEVRIMELKKNRKLEQTTTA